MSTVTDALRESRYAAGITQRELARMLGITPSYLSQIESGSVPLPKKFYSELPDEIRPAVVEAKIAWHKAAILAIRPLLSVKPK